MLPAPGHPEAVAELLEAVEWYERDQPELGQKFMGAVRDALSKVISGLVKGGPALPGQRQVHVRRIVLTRWPYAIVYIERDAEIWIVAVAHQHRKPGYWHRRIPR